MPNIPQAGQQGKAHSLAYGREVLIRSGQCTSSRTSTYLTFNATKLILAQLIDKSNGLETVMEHSSSNRGDVAINWKMSGLYPIHTNHLKAGMEQSPGNGLEAINWRQSWSKYMEDSHWTIN